jgi:hypothetical protein
MPGTQHFRKPTPSAADLNVGKNIMNQKNIRLAGVVIIMTLFASSIFAANKPAKGNAMIVGIQKGKTEIFIRTVDGAAVGNLPFKPDYKHEVSAGSHKIQAFCTVHNDWGNQMGPADVIEQEFVEGHIYQLECVGRPKNYIVKANDITAGK